MEKRGVKGKSRQASHTSAVRHASLKKASPGTRPKKAAQSKAPKGKRKLEIRRPSVIRSAEKFMRKEERVVEKDVEKEVRFLLSPEEFHVVTFVACLIILAFLLDSTSLIFYSVITMGALAFAHFLRQHHRPHDVLTILGLFFLPLAFTIALFRDLLVWLLLGVYLVSAVSTIMIYYVHKKAHAPLKIMWQVTYSRIIAITVAVIMVCLLPFMLPDTFLSVYEMIFVLVLPIALAFFFMSKFFYLYFFDRKHIRHDLWLSFKHGLIYTLAFMVILMGVYAVMASNFYNSRMESYDANLDVALIGVSEIETSMSDLPEETQKMMVVKDVSGFATLLRTEMTDEKVRLANNRLSFADIVDDTYFDAMGDNAFNILRFVVLQSELGNLRELVLDSEEELTVFYGQFDDPDGSMLAGYADELKADLDTKFVPYSQDPDVAATIAAVDDPYTDYSYFDENGLFFWFAEETGMTSIYHSESIVGRQLSLALRHLRPFRTLAETTIKSLVFLDAEASSTSVVEYLYQNRESDLTPMSRAIRYSVIKGDLDARDSRFDDARRVDFRVE